MHKVHYSLVMMVRLRHCSSISPCDLPFFVNGVSNINRRMLLLRSKYVCLSHSSFSSKYGVTCVTWMYAICGLSSAWFTCRSTTKQVNSNGNTWHKVQVATFSKFLFIYSQYEWVTTSWLIIASRLDRDEINKRRRICTITQRKVK